MKVFIQCGTQSISFARLWEFAVRMDKADVYRVFFQGYDFTNNLGKSTGLAGSQFLHKLEYQKLILESDIVICHAGSGAIFDSIRNGHKPYVLPRLQKFKEHNDDHQLDLYEKCKSANIIQELDLNQIRLKCTVNKDNIINARNLFNGRLKSVVTKLIINYTI